MIYEPLVLSGFRVVTWIPQRWSQASSSLTFQYSPNHHCNCVCVCACVRQSQREGKREIMHVLLREWGHGESVWWSACLRWLQPRGVIGSIESHLSSHISDAVAQLFCTAEACFANEFYWSTHRNEKYEDWREMKDAQANIKGSKNECESFKVQTFYSLWLCIRSHVCSLNLR